ncbi:MAG TPA: urea ABC transporter substrate-binding protein, partial [Methylophilus sp.]|nr:urea ABC transporter substrate-binding protein [Methylophilus sp.]
MSTLNRRGFMKGALLGAMMAAGLISGHAFAADFPTAKVNTTGLAVTDTTVKVGILHSATGTMAISETGSIQAE